MSSCSDLSEDEGHFCLKDTVRQAHRDIDFIICFVILMNLNATLLFGPQADNTFWSVPW